MDDPAFAQLFLGAGIACGRDHDCRICVVYDFQRDFYGCCLWEKPGAKSADEGLSGGEWDLHGGWSGCYYYDDGVAEFK